MMEITPEIQERSEKIQAEIQHIVDATFTPVKGLVPSNAKYQDCMNVAIFTKLAELELKNEELEKRLDTHLDRLDGIYFILKLLNAK